MPLVFVFDEGEAYGYSNIICGADRRREVRARQRDLQVREDQAGQDCRAQGSADVELLDFGVGEPDQLAPFPVREALKEAVDDPSNRGYADNGIREFRNAAARYMKDFFGVVNVDPDTEINHSIGSKTALAMLPLCFVNPGDTVLTTVPGYPVLATHAGYLGGKVVKIPLRRENGFLPDLKNIGAEELKPAKLFYVNYPNNPTGAAATEEFFDALIEFAGSTTS